MKKSWALLGFLFFSSAALGAANTTQVNVLSYSSTNVTTSAYVALVASTPISVSKLEVCDTSGKILKIASGQSGSELDLFSVQVSGCIVVPYYLPAGSRLSIKAIDATASSGYNVLSFLND